MQENILDSSWVTHQRQMQKYVCRIGWLIAAISQILLKTVPTKKTCIYDLNNKRLEHHQINALASRCCSTMDGHCTSHQLPRSRPSSVKVPWMVCRWFGAYWPHVMFNWQYSLILVDHIIWIICILSAHHVSLLISMLYCKALKSSMLSHNSQ